MVIRALFTRMWDGLKRARARQHILLSHNYNEFTQQIELIELKCCCAKACEIDFSLDTHACTHSHAYATHRTAVITNTHTNCVFALGPLLDRSFYASSFDRAIITATECGKDYVHDPIGDARAIRRYHHPCVQR